MNLQLNTSIPLITVFVQGILSFLSPCVLPLVPVYLGYLAGGGYKNVEGKMEYPRKRAIIHSFFFVLGLSFTFYLLGFGFTVFGEIFSNHREIFAKASGVIMILFGVQAFPTTIMITADGYIYGHVTGGLTAEMMENIVQQTLKNN